MQGKQKRVAMGIVIAAIVLIVGGSLLGDSERRSRLNKRGDKSKYGAEFRLVGTETANIGYIAERLYKIYENEMAEYGKIDSIEYTQAFENTANNDEINALANADILSSFGIIESYDADTVITKYSLSEAIYKIVKLVDKDSVQLSSNYSDIVDRKYIESVGLADRAEAFSIEDNNMFIGSRVLTEYEADTALDKFEKYIKVLKRRTPDEKGETDTAVSYTNTEAFKIEITEEERREAEQILWDKTFFEDNLNGRSVAIHTKPKSIEELKINIERLVEIDPYNVGKYNPNFINIDEGLYDYEAVHIGTDYEEEFGYREIKMEQIGEYDNQNNDTAVINKSIGKPDIIARSKALNGMAIQFGRTQMIKLSHPMLKTISLQKTEGEGSQFRQDCYLIRNGKVIGKGYIMMAVSMYSKESEMSLNFKWRELKDAEYIGIITQKRKIDNGSSMISTLLLMDIPDEVKASIINKEKGGGE